MFISALLLTEATRDIDQVVRSMPSASCHCGSLGPKPQSYAIHSIRSKRVLLVLLGVAQIAAHKKNSNLT